MSASRSMSTSLHATWEAWSTHCNCVARATPSLLLHTNTSCEDSTAKVVILSRVQVMLQCGISSIC